jgi:hypothetical protein
MDGTAVARSPAAASTHHPRGLFVAAAGYGLFVWLLLPAGISAINDDFGYLRSIVQTIQHGRPWTDDWLEPWAASFSALAALLYWITGNFSVATHGLLALLAGAAFVAAGLLLQQRGSGDRWRVLAIVTLALTFPTVLWKTTEFTGVALYFPCLLLALWSAAEKRWVLFFLSWLFAVATRQSAIVWMLIPLWSAGREALSQEGKRVSWSWIMPLLIVASGALVFLGLRHGMNQTHAQALLSEQAFGRIDPRAAARVVGVGTLVFLGAAGWGSFLVGGRGYTPRRNASALATKILLGLLLVALLIWDERSWVQSEHTLFSGAIGWSYTKLLVAVGVGGWLRGGFRLRPDYAFFALGSLGLVAVRGIVWDYYLLEPAVLGFFAVVAVEQSEAPAFFPSRWLLALVASFHLVFVLDLKCTLDRARALCALSESALRSGRLEPAELSYAPFGFTAWQLYPHYATHEGVSSTDLAGFNGYLRRGAVEVGQGYSKALHIFPRFRHEPPGDRHNLIASGRYRFLWFFHAEFYLLRFKSAEEQPAEWALTGHDYERPAFPLNDEEWDQSIAIATTTTWRPSPASP